MANQGKDRLTLSVVRTPLRALSRAIAGAVVVAALLPISSQAQRGDIPRTVSGKPDLNGIWQALGNTHWDIEPHQARAALAMQPGPMVPVPANEVLAFGAVGAVPSGLGVVAGGEIPYLPDALAKKRENQENWLSRDPEIKCYLPGVPRATYMPFPFQIFQSEQAFFIAYEYAGGDTDFRSFGKWKWRFHFEGVARQHRGNQCQYTNDLHRTTPVRVDVA